MISVAVIGTGGIYQAHIKGYLAFPQRYRITRQRAAIASTIWK